MRVLIDACLPVELKTLLEGMEVKTARDMGWQRLDACRQVLAFRGRAKREDTLVDA